MAVGDAVVGAVAAVRDVIVDDLETVTVAVQEIRLLRTKPSLALDFPDPKRA